MIKRISHLAPLQFGIVLATTYGLLSLIFVPFFIIFALLGAHTQGSGMPFGLAVVMAIIFPIVYAVLGFIFGVIGAFIYNLVAGWTGGIELTLSDVAPALPPQGGAPTTY